MTVREIALQHGISVQAVYKKLKQAGINLATLKDGSGKLTEAGAQKINELLQPLAAAEPPPAADSEELNRLTTQVEKLTTEVEKLTTQVETLTSERDYLRTALEREQALHGLALQRIALPAPEDSTGFKGRFKAFTERFKKKGGAANE